MTVDPPAKLNLGLRILRKRNDGFHDIETVMVAIDWRDRLAYTAEGPFRFTCSDPSLPTDEGNLCVRAARRLAELAGEELRGHLHLEKQIPHGAGLGGGSSDAAYTIRLLSDTTGWAVSPTALSGIAAELGSDVPFFLQEGPMRATGRGEVLEPVPDVPILRRCALAVITPAVRISTADAYGQVTPSDRFRTDLIQLMHSEDLSAWRTGLRNDFQQPIATRYPVISVEIEAMYRAGAGYAAMSGSGSSVFGVFHEEGQAVDFLTQARDRGHTAWHGRALI